ELARSLENPAIPGETKQQVVRGALAQAAPGLDPMLKNLANMLISRERFHLIRAIHDEFTVLVNELRGITNAEVVTAIPLSDDQRERLATELTRATHQQV